MSLDATVIVIDRKKQEMITPVNLKAVTEVICQEKNKGVIDKDHVLYHPRVAVLGDSHGKGEPPVKDALSICTGDYMDPKAGFIGLDPKGAILDPQRFKESQRKWIESIKSGEAKYILGNHDVAFLSAMLVSPDKANDWYETHEGRKICAVYNIATPAPPINKDNWNSFKDAILNASDKTLFHFYETLLTHGQLYAVVNETYMSHTLPLTNKDGSLFEISVRGQKLSGMKLLDFFENNLRELGKAKVTGVIEPQTYANAINALKILNSGYYPQTDIHTPLWVRDEPVQNVMLNADVATRLITDLDAQGKRKGTRVKRVLYGHVQGSGSTDETKNIVNIDYSGRLFPPGMQKDLYALLTVTSDSSRNGKVTLEHCEPEGISFNSIKSTYSLN